LTTPAVVPAPKRYVAITDKKGDIIAVDDVWGSLWNKAAAVWPHKSDWVFIPDKSFFGKSLHTSDSDWAAYHPFTEGAGVSMARIPTFVHQLVEPYGLAVSRIRVIEGFVATDEVLATWQASLGVNPLALVDNTTTNADAAEQLGVEVEALDQACRFEYGIDPLRPSIIGELSNVGTGGGHARYFAPRDYPKDWKVSVQLAPAEAVQYAVEPSLPEYAPREGTLAIITSELKDPDGKRLDSWTPPVYSHSPVSHGYPTVPYNSSQGGRESLTPLSEILEEEKERARRDRDEPDPLYNGLGW
jgi:hypothetical protein